MYYQVASWSQVGLCLDGQFAQIDVWPQGTYRVLKFKVGFLRLGLPSLA